MKIWQVNFVVDDDCRLPLKMSTFFIDDITANSFISSMENVKHFSFLTKKEVEVVIPSTLNVLVNSLKEG